MPNQDFLHVGITELSPLRVAHKLCIFSTPPRKMPDKRIRAAFQALREYALGFGLDPDSLLHIGIPTLDDGDLVTYDCCIEFPLPIEEGNSVQQETLSGGRYAVLRIEKKTDKIPKAIRQFRGDYIPENRLIVDESRPVYEIYYIDTMEYCVPILRDGRQSD